MCQSITETLWCGMKKASVLMQIGVSFITQSYEGLLYLFIINLKCVLPFHHPNLTVRTTRSYSDN